jgi:hypothetical protein
MFSMPPWLRFVVHVAILLGMCLHMSPFTAPVVLAGVPCLAYAATAMATYLNNTFGDHDKYQRALWTDKLCLASSLMTNLAACVVIWMGVQEWFTPVLVGYTVWQWIAMELCRQNAHTDRYGQEVADLKLCTIMGQWLLSSTAGAEFSTVILASTQYIFFAGLLRGMEVANPLPYAVPAVAIAAALFL